MKYDSDVVKGLEDAIAYIKGDKSKARESSIGFIDNILGECVGVKFTPRAAGDSHVMLQLMIEDDEHWHGTNFRISSFWLGDMIDVLQRVQNTLDNTAENDTYGYSFKRSD